MNSSSTVSAEVGLRLVTTPQTIAPPTGSLFYSPGLPDRPDGQENGQENGQESGHIDAELNDSLRQAS